MTSMRIVQRLQREAARKTIEDAQKTLGVTYADLAKALRVHYRSVVRYRKEESTPLPKIRDRMENLREICTLLDEVFSTPEARQAWLHSSVPVLRERRPIDLIRHGELVEVLSVLAGMYSGAFG